MDPQTRLQALLQKSNLVEVAAQTKVPLRTLYRLASGESKAPNAHNLLALLLWADGLRIPRISQRPKPGPRPKPPRPPV